MKVSLANNNINAVLEAFEAKIDDFNPMLVKQAFKALYEVNYLIIYKIYIDCVIYLINFSTPCHITDILCIFHV